MEGFISRRLRIFTQNFDIRNMPLQVRFDHLIEIIVIKSGKVENLYFFYARSTNEVSYFKG